MSKFVIEGGVPLNGRHYSPGNKNAALPMIAAALLADGPVEIANLPLIRDVSVMLELVSELGAGVSLDRAARTVAIDPRTLRKSDLPEDLCNRIRTSILFAGPLVAKTGGVVLPPPGGDVIGRRRLDTHFEGLRRLGVAVDPERTPYVFSSPSGLRGAKMILDEASVTATENIVMAATLAEGRTEIFNAACEPHVQDLCRMLVDMGAKIAGIGTNLLVVDGVKALHGARVRVSPDFIESASFIAAAAATHGAIVIDETREHDFEILRRPFARLGVTWTRDAATGALAFDSRQVELRIATEMSGAIAKIEDGIWPQTPTDLLSVLLVLATQADGIVLFFEKMFESRMYFVDSLINMGAQIVQCDPHRVVVKGVSKLRGAKLLSPDIRAGMALLVAGLCADGVTTIANAESIDRGYEPVETALAALGARITRIPD